MARINIDRNTLPQFLERLDNLQANAERRWGTLDVTAMLRHLRNVFETPLGERTYSPEKMPLPKPLLYFLLCRLFTTWPKGRIKAPDYWTPPAEHEFEEERRLLIEKLRRFVTALDEDPGLRRTNPFFGDLTLAQWSRLNGIHLDHHFKQFGV